MFSSAGYGNEESTETWKQKDNFIFIDEFRKIILNELYLFQTNTLGVV